MKLVLPTTVNTFGTKTGSIIGAVRHPSDDETNVLPVLPEHSTSLFNGKVRADEQWIDNRPFAQ